MAVTAGSVPRCPALCASPPASDCWSALVGGGRWVAARPEQGLGNDRGSVVDGQRRRAVQLVSKVQGLADAIAERGIVRPGEHAITGKPVSGHATSLESQRRRP